MRCLYLSRAVLINSQFIRQDSATRTEMCEPLPIPFCMAILPPNMYDWARVRRSVSWTMSGRNYESRAGLSVEETMAGNRSNTNPLQYMAYENFKDSPRA